jgi:hypothetical protein
MENGLPGSHRARPARSNPSDDQSGPQTSPRHRVDATILPDLPAGPPVKKIRISPTIAVAAVGLMVAAVAPVGLAVGGLTGSNASPSTTKTLTFKAVADTYIAQGAPKTSEASSTKLVSTAAKGKAKMTLLRFTVSGIPAGATDVHAALVLHRDAHKLPATTVSVNKISASWTEGVTWANRPATGAKIATAAVNSSMAGVTVDLGKQVATGAVAFEVSTAVAADTTRFMSRETASPPQLQVTYTPAVAKPSPSPTSTGNPAPTTSSSSPSSTTTTSSAPSSSSTTSSSASSGHCTVSAKLVPTCGELWGVAPGAFTTQVRTAALLDFEKTVGQTMDIFHAYHKDDDQFPTADERAIATDPSHPRLLLENWKPSTSQTWAQVADGGADARIDKLAAYINSTFKGPFFLTIWHEPENDVNMTAGSGMTATDYHNMFRHVVLRLRADGVNNAVTVVNYQSYAEYSAQSWWPDLYPGNDVVDWVAEDSYNSGAMSGYNAGDFAATVDKTKDSWHGFYNWAAANHPDKPVMLAEWGIFQNASAPGRQAWFFNDVRTHLADFPQLKAMVYFDSPSAPKGSTNFNQSADSLSAFKTLIGSTPPIALP